MAEDLDEHDEEDRDVAGECGSGPVVGGRSRHRAENEDVVCGGSRKWSCRETTTMVAPVSVDGGRRKPRRNWRARTWQRRRSGDLEC